MYFIIFFLKGTFLTEFENMWTNQIIVTQITEIFQSNLNRLRSFVLGYKNSVVELPNNINI